MPLRRSTFQSSVESLDPFYAEMEEFDSDPISKGGKNMRKLVAWLNTEFPSTDLWGFTSHDHLCLQAVPEFGSPWFVAIGAYADEIIVEHILPEKRESMEIIRRATDSLEIAKSFIRSAMIESEGWPDSLDLADDRTRGDST